MRTEAARPLYPPLITPIYNKATPTWHCQVYTPLTSPNYPRAPITEAVIELRVETQLATGAVEKIAKRLKKSFDTVAPLQQVNLVLDMTGSGATAVQQQITGHRFTTYDQADIALLTPVNLTTACLAPYPGWDTFRSKARENWTHWTAVASAHPVARVGVRYINSVRRRMLCDNLRLERAEALARLG